jgi:hypothetical protein
VITQKDVGGGMMVLPLKEALNAQVLDGNLE